MLTQSSIAKPGIALIAAALLLSGCGAAERIKNIGKAPEMAPIENVPAPIRERSISLPMPSPPQTESRPNSLWRAGARAFFKDQRAKQVGDLLTVEIQINDQATVENSTARSRTNSENSQIPNFLGFEQKLLDILPTGANVSSLTDFGSSSTTGGSGTVDRDEQINLTLAATVSHILPNGNLIIEGRQEVRVNFEVRELLVAGVIRPEDISNSNTIAHTQIAEARISYGGRGQLTDVQQARYGQQLYDILFPF